MTVTRSRPTRERWPRGLSRLSWKGTHRLRFLDGVEVFALDVLDECEFVGLGLSDILVDGYLGEAGLRRSAISASPAMIMKVAWPTRRTTMG